MASLLFCAFGANTRAATNSIFDTTEPSARMSNRAGAYIGILGDPFPTLLGVNLGYNVTDFMRVSVGGGRVSASIGDGVGDGASASATTFGVGTRFFVPGWSISPTVGLGAAYVAVSQSGGLSVSVQNFNSSGGHIYGNLGVDWQMKGGFNAGLGYNLSFRSGIGGSPYLDLGWFFDFI